MRDTDTIAADRLVEGVVRLLSHDLRSPLGPLTLAASALEEDPRLDDDQRALARMAVAQAERMARLVDATLAAVRGPRAPATRPVDVAAMVADVAQRYEQLGGSGDRRSIAATVPVDPELMRDALLGLVEVAGGGTGRVDVQVTREAAGVRIALVASDPDGCAAGLTAELPRDWRSALALGAAAVVRAHGGIVVATPEGAAVLLEAG